MLQCSFCAKTEDKVKKLVAGPKVFICDECVEIAVRIMNENPDVRQSFLKRLWKRLMSSGTSRFDSQPAH